MFFTLGALALTKIGFLQWQNGTKYKFEQLVLEYINVMQLSTSTTFHREITFYYVYLTATSYIPDQGFTYKIYDQFIKYDALL